MKGLNDMPKLHKREVITREAERKFLEDLIALRKKYEITDIEFLQIVMTEVQSVLKYMLRYERHGNYDTPAGIEEE